MTTLTQTAQIARKMIVLALVLPIIMLTGAIVWKLTPVAGPEQIIVPTPTPSVLFGKLPPVSFPASGHYPTGLKLETIEGGPPVSTSSAYVYFVPKKAPNLFSRKNAVDFAEQLGFTDNPVDISPTMLKFTDSHTNDTFEIDITTKNYKLKRNFIDKGAFEEKQLPSEGQLTKMAKDYFTAAMIWDYTLTESAISYIRFEGSDLVSVENAEDAHLVRVDFYPGSVGGQPVIPADLHFSDTYVIFSVRNGQLGVTWEASYQSNPPDTLYPATYPTISGQAAWEKLVTGGGFIAQPAGDFVTVREGYMVYIKERSYQSYYQPAYVFEGDGGFVGIVPAIDPSWTGQ